MTEINSFSTQQTSTGQVSGDHPGFPRWLCVPKAKKRVNAEKRQHPRFRINPGMPAIRVALQPLSGGEEGLLRGKVHNFSAGGFCLVADHMVQPSQVFRCVIPFPDLPFVIPTLLRTRWCKRRQQARKYFAGLQFLS